MNNPSSSGMGQGAAQVFDTRGVLNTFVRVSMMEQQQRQIDEQNLAKMMSQFDPSKLRAADQAKYSQMYNELQNTYMKNKDLYRNPLKHQSDYNKVQGLVNDMRSLAARSKQYEATMQNAGKEVTKKNRYTPQAIEKFQAFNSMPSDDIFIANGSRDISLADFDYIPDAPDPKDVRATIESMARKDGAVIQTDPVKTKISDAKDNITINSVVSSQYLPKYANALLMREGYRSHYDYQWEQLPVEMKNEITLDLAKRFTGFNQQSGAEKMALWDAYNNHSVLDSKTTMVDNEDFKNSEWDRRDNKNFEQQKALQRSGQAFSLKVRDMNKAEAEYEQQYGTNWNDEHAKQLQSELYYAKSAGTSKQRVMDLISPFERISAYTENGVNVLFPEDYNSKDDFVRAVRATTGDAESKLTSFAMTDYGIGRAFETGRPIPTFVMSDNNGEKNAYLLDVSTPGFVKKASQLAQDFGLGAKTTGFGLGTGAYSQKPTTRKKVTKK